MKAFARISLLSALLFAPLACSSSDSNTPPPDGNPPPGGGGCSGDGCFAVSLSTSLQFSCAVMKDGTARCWGRSEGSRGRGAAENDPMVPEPKPVVELANATAIASNLSNTCALVRGGTVSCWGIGGSDGIGTGQAEGSDTPKAVTISGVQALVEEDSLMCALLQDGTASCWQTVTALAPEKGDPALVPYKIPAVQGAKEIAIGINHLCALDAAGVVKCFGENSLGELGYETEDRERSNELRPVEGLETATHVRSGGSSTCAVLTNGGLKCWGENRGNGSADAGFEAVAVTGLSDVADVAVGGTHSCAILKNGEVWCWGSDENAELGDGIQSTERRLAPVKVQGLGGKATALSLAQESTCAIRDDGKVACWGSNPYGQLGVTTESTVKTPTVVPF